LRIVSGPKTATIADPHIGHIHLNGFMSEMSRV
jgi:hypothetical protein